MWSSHLLLFFFFRYLIKMFVEMSATQKSKESTKKTRGSIPAVAVLQVACQTLAWGGLLRFQLIVACRIHAALFQVHHGYPPPCRPFVLYIIPFTGHFFIPFIVTSHTTGTHECLVHCKKANSFKSF